MCWFISPDSEHLAVFVTARNELHSLLVVILTGDSDSSLHSKDTIEVEVNHMEAVTFENECGVFADRVASLELASDIGQGHSKGRVKQDLWAECNLDTTIGLLHCLLLDVNASNSLKDSSIPLVKVILSSQSTEGRHSLRSQNNSILDVVLHRGEGEPSIIGCESNDTLATLK